MSTATDMLAAYQAAEIRILQGQSVRFGDRILTRANLDWVQQGRREWEGKVAAEKASAAGSTNGYSVADFSGCQ